MLESDMEQMHSSVNIVLEFGGGNDQTHYLTLQPTAVAGPELVQELKDVFSEYVWEKGNRLVIEVPAGLQGVYLVDERNEFGENSYIGVCYQKEGSFKQIAIFSATEVTKTAYLLRKAFLFLGPIMVNIHRSLQLLDDEKALAFAKRARKILSMHEPSVTSNSIFNWSSEEVLGSGE